MTSPSTQRSLFCECNKTPCQCWPTSATPRSRKSSRSTRQPASSPSATRWLHYDPAQQLPSPYTPSEPKRSPAQRGYVPSTDPAIGTQYTSPGSSSSKSPYPGQPQLHALLKAQSILRTPESPAALRLQWDVRDAPTKAIIASNHEPEYLYNHPSSVAYATSPPVPFMLIACNDALPWVVPVHARPGSAGVTVRDIIQAVHDTLYLPVEENMLRLLPSDDDRARLYNAYRERIARNGDDRRGILAVDWLGEKSLFVCLGRDEALAKRLVTDKAMWPHVYALKLKLRRGTLVSDV